VFDKEQRRTETVGRGRETLPALDAKIFLGGSVALSAHGRTGLVTMRVKKLRWKLRWAVRGYRRDAGDLAT
jgi:hypothetical protein